MIRNAILHDIKHKPFKLKHNPKEKDLDTTADQDASRMSRPRIAYDNPLKDDFLRKSFVFDFSFKESDRKRFAIYCIKEYIESNDTTQKLHTKLLNDTIISNFNEVTSMPYTSLKYHTLIVCALHYNYKKDMDFQDLYLNYTDDYKEQYTTIFNFGNVKFVINNDSNGTCIGTASPFFGQCIGRLNNLPFPTYIVENLRRFRSWSIGLQYLEDALTKLKQPTIGGDM